MGDGVLKGNIIITGASGFLGRNLIGSLLRDGFSDNGSSSPARLIGFSSSPDKLRERFPSDLAEFHDRKKIDDAELRYIWKDAIVVNCAFPRNRSGTEMAEGLSYIKRVFEAAAGNGAAAVINISSQSVYAADRQDAAGEDTPLCLATCYAVGKYAVELMLESICANTGTAFTSVRMASLIGPDFDPRIVNCFVRQALQIVQRVGRICKYNVEFLVAEGKEIEYVVPDHCHVLEAQTGGFRLDERSVLPKHLNAVNP